MGNKTISSKNQVNQSKQEKSSSTEIQKSNRSNYKKVLVRRDLQVEKLPADYEKALYDYVDTYLDFIKKDLERYEMKVAALAAYKKERSTVAVGGGRVKTRVLKIDFGESSLAPLMEIADLNYYDLFNNVFGSLIKEKRESNGFAVVQPCQMKPDEMELQNICDSLADSQFEKLRKLGLKMSPSFWSTPQAQTWTPTERVWAIIGRKLPVRAKGSMFPIELRTPGIVKALNDKHHDTRIPIEDIPAIAEYFHISFHWLVMGSERISATAKYPRTENVLTAYCFMSEAAKKDFLSVARYIAEKTNAGEEA